MPISNRTNRFNRQSKLLNVLTQQQAQQVAEAWIRAFNAHNLPAILDHYADELAFYFPFIVGLKFNESGCISTKTDLERYFQVGLRTYPDLHFTLHTIFTGIDTLVIQYTSVNNRLASEVFQLDEHGKVNKVYCHYAPDKSLPVTLLNDEP